MFLLLSFVSYLRPVIFIPPMLGTQLHMTLNNFQTSLWSCPTTGA
jgi:hypothetical protein